MKIGRVKVDGKLVLAPMANVTNLPFRVLCRRQGAALVYTEMVNLNALARENKATKKLTLVAKEERPISVQLFGLREDPIKKAIEQVEPIADIIDFNFGCPASKIIGSGSGAALLKRPEKIGKIIEFMVKHSSKPVTAKIRLGYDKNDSVKIAKVIEDAGADAIAVHARTYKQGFRGKADHKAIKKVKEAVNIPVIGNGDVRDGKSAKKLLKYCDAVMIGRGAMGDPMVFHRINTYLKNGKEEDMPTFNEKIDLFLEYYELAKENGLARLHILKQRAQDFTCNIKGATTIRRELNKIENEELLMKYMKSLKE